MRRMVVKSQTTELIAYACTSGFRHGPARSSVKPDGRTDQEIAVIRLLRAGP